jgi:hypothetical protein
MNLLNVARRLDRWAAGILFVLCGLLTFILFYATGGPVPSRFVPAEELGFAFGAWQGLPGPNGKPQFLGLSPSGRCYITNWLKPTDAGSLEPFATLWDTATGQEIGAFRGGVETRWHFEISPDRSVVFTTKNGRMAVRQFKAGGEEVTPILTEWNDSSSSALFGMGANTVFSHDSRQLLVHSLQFAIPYDLEKRKPVASIRVPAFGSVFVCFFDSHNRAKVLAFNGSWEVWDGAASNLDVTLDKRLPEDLGELGNAVISSGSAVYPPTLVRLTKDLESLLTRSLEDGSIQKVMPVPAPGAKPIRFSPDGRFLLCCYQQQHPLMLVARRLGESAEEWLWKHGFGAEKRLALVDLQTGSARLGLIGDENCAFTDDSSRLISLSSAGRYEYGVPPRWQYFTPWAWAVLGGWFGFRILWWRSIGRPRLR